MKFFENGNTQLFALGGMGEVGKNMYVIMHNNEIIIIDSGVMFPKDELLGIDYVIPDYTFLKENESKIKALLITHGHEDHIGGIPFLLQTVNIPTIYAPNQAKELIALKLQDKNIRYDRLKIRPNRNYTYEEAMDRDLNEIEKLSKGGPICYADYYILNNTTIEDEINSLKNILNKIK